MKIQNIEKRMEGRGDGKVKEELMKLLEPKEVGVDGYEYNDDILLDYKPTKTKEEKTL